MQLLFICSHTFVLRDSAIPLIELHSAGMGTTPPERRASAAWRRSPFVQVKNLEDIVDITFVEIRRSTQTKLQNAETWQRLKGDVRDFCCNTRPSKIANSSVNRSPARLGARVTMPYPPGTFHLTDTYRSEAGHAGWSDEAKGYFAAYGSRNRLVCACHMPCWWHNEWTRK